MSGRVLQGVQYAGRQRRHTHTCLSIAFHIILDPGICDELSGIMNLHCSV